MRVLLAFVTTVALIIAVSAAFDGDWGTVAIAGAVLAVAGALLWRNMHDPEATRALGLKCKVTFVMADIREIVTNGTQARIVPLRKTFGKGWDITINRAPERGDLALIDTAQRGWVWLGPDNLPRKVKIEYGTSWKTWDVLMARPMA